VDAREFLASVVPWTGGYVTLHWKRPDESWPGRSCRTLEDMLQYVAALKAGQNDIYFCLSAQRLNSGQRSLKNSFAVASLWTDLDVDPDDPKKYPSVEEAVASLLHFCQLLEIPYPSIIVLSGGGVHAYWLSDRVLTIDEWRPYALALKTVAKNSLLKIDGAVTADASRILRVPGTMNFKYTPPRPVRLLQQYCNGKRHDFSKVFAALLAIAPAAPAPRGPIPIAEAFQGLNPKANLGEGIESPDIPPLPFEPIKDNCGWLREAIETGGKNFDEPQWNLTTLCATFLEDGHEYAHKLGDQHPTYMRGKTDEKWERKCRERRDKNLGWPSCEAISAAGSTHCGTCPHWQKINSPLSFGFAALKPAVPAVDAEIEALGGTRPSDLRLPEGFAIDEKGRICAVYASTIVAKKVVPGRLLHLFNNRLSNVSLQSRNGRLGLAFVATADLGSTTEIFLDMANTYAPKLFNYLAERNVSHNPDTEAKKMAEKFTASWLDLLMVEDVAVRDQGIMGWHYKDGHRSGFAFGTSLYHLDGAIIPLRAAADEEMRKYYTPMGRREPWLAAAKLLTDRKRPELMAILAIPFAAPLMVFAGTLYGAMLSVYGDPGTAKSTAQQVAAAVWGHPKQTRESLNSTAKSVQGRLGRTRNLPAYWDDIQDERHQQALFDSMFVTAEGAEGGRLNPDATYKQRLEWQTLMVACSNVSFVDYVLKKQKSTTAGMRRVFEINFPKQKDEPGLINPLDAGQIFAQLEHNYGVIGAEYAQLLVRNHDDISTLTSEVTKRFCAQVQGSVDEAYWWGICGVLLTGAALAVHLGAELDVPAMEEYLLHQFLKNRKLRRTEGTEGGSYDNTERALTLFMNFYSGSGNIMFVDRQWIGRFTPIERVKDPLPGRPIYIQIARDERKILISKHALRSFLEKNEIQPRPVFLGMNKFFKARDVRMTMGAGTPFAQTQELCFEITIPFGKYEFLENIISAMGRAK
jgi:hypothetical protein